MEWFAADPGRYTFASDLPLFALAAIAVLGTGIRRADSWLSARAGTSLVLVLVALTLVAGRWPTLFVVQPLNEDEAQALAQAITALHDPVPWRGFDGNTCGPLNTYVLMLPALFGAHLTFLTARSIALALEFGAIASLFMAVRLCFDASLARVALLAPTAFFALATQDHFVHYSGEHLSIFLGMLMLALTCAAYRRDLAPGWLFCAGIAGGMMPFAKLQCVPLLGAYALLVGVLVLARGARGGAVRAAAFVAGLLLAPAVLLSLAAAGGSVQDFWTSYILTSLAYFLYEDLPLSFLTMTPEFGALFDVLALTAGAGAVALVARYGATTPRQRGAFAGAVLVLLGALWTIFAPRRGSLNYLLFAVLPAAGAAAAGLGILAAVLRLRRASAGRAALALTFVLCALGAMSAFLRGPYPYLDAVATYSSGARDPVTALIERYVRPGQRLAIWGWRPEYFVTTSTLLGTRDAITRYQYSQNFNPYIAYFRRRYIADFEANKPVGFLDAGAVSFDFREHREGGFESFPELAAIVERDYRLVGSANGMYLFVRRPTT